MNVETVHRITGPHLLLPKTGAAVWLQVDKEESWSSHKETIFKRIEAASSGLPFGGKMIEHHYDGGVAIAISAPPDLLYTACAVLEWATSQEPKSGELWDSIDSERQNEEAAHLRDLHEWASTHRIQAFDDEDGFTLGLGCHHQTWPLDGLPQLESLTANRFDNVPIAYITGTNGKTTSTRMLARIAQAHGLTPGHTSSDGVVINGESVEHGDWTGPGAARIVLRHRAIDVALLETARGGLMRRGLVLGNADAAVVTNISADHLGEWGLTNVERLADAKLVVARGLRPGGTLILGSECAILNAAVERLPHSIRDTIAIKRFGSRSKSQETIGLDAWIQEDQLVFKHNGLERTIHVQEIPTSLNGVAVHNIHNAGVAGLAALALGWSFESVERGLKSLHPNPDDSRGRANLYELEQKYVLLDFAHNPGGLKMMAELSRRFRPGDRYLLMGQAGDRSPELIQGLANAAVEIGLAGVVVKNLPEHAYERDPDEIALSQVEALVRAGQVRSSIEHVPDEVEAASRLLDRATPGSLTFLIGHENVDGMMQMLQSRKARLATPPPREDS